VPRRVITFGTFDLFHVGHLLLLERAAGQGDELVVGIATDALTRHRKGRDPVFPEEHRMAIVAAVRCVAAVFPEECFEDKPRHVVERGADVLVMGDDWVGHFDHLAALCEVRYVPRTPAISTTATIAAIADRGGLTPVAPLAPDLTPVAPLAPDLTPVAPLAPDAAQVIAR
jgi:glycerol-3-phosphate cytidylyltransferase